MPCTVAADAFRKMADPGEITGADMGGPPAMDNAAFEPAARIGDMPSPIAGRAGPASRRRRSSSLRPGATVGARGISAKEDQVPAEGGLKTACAMAAGDREGWPEVCADIPVLPQDPDAVAGKPEDAADPDVARSVTEHCGRHLPGSARPDPARRAALLPHSHANLNDGLPSGIAPG
jgi:hypothetical protein